MQEKQQSEHKQGAPWKVVKKTTTYDDAASYRDDVLSSWKKDKTTDMQIKIKRMNDPEGFTVRTRVDPDTVVAKKKGKTSKGKKKVKDADVADTEKND